MLTAADVIAGKLLVQLGDVTAERARAVMRAAAADASAQEDLVARLQAEGLDQAKVTRIRRYVGLYEMVRAEAVYLTLLEKRHGVPRAEAHDLLARIEADVYRSRLGALLVEAGRLTAEEDRALVQRARQAMAAEDAKVVARYARDDFEGVARPLVRAPKVTAAAFTASTIFRSPETARLVRAEVERLRGLADPVPATGGDVDFAPPEALLAQAEPAPGGLDLDRLARADTARFLQSAPDPAAGDLRGRREIGPYEVVECLGQGGMGAVYLARDPESAGALVAVKVLHTGRAGPDDQARFQRELAVMRLVDHPDVVALIDEGRTADGLDFVVLQAFPGRPLRAHLREGGPLPLDAGLRLLERLLEALGAVHAAGVVHRDVKPENVFVIAGPERAVKLLDLGIARRIDHGRPAAERLFRTRAGVISGSPAYVAPETITDDPIDGRTDVYSLGVLLFEALTGRLPLVADSPYEYLREHLLGVPLTLGQARKDVAWSPDLERLVARMLAKERDHRPTCADILGALRGGLAEAAVRHAQAPPAATKESGVVKGLYKLLNRATWS
ncbi:MAG: serine/threonine protein kinase [Planctomycetes bacterium]|nr:serine/threonine protein kinase [Planctomycetota bacterium]